MRFMSMKFTGFLQSLGVKNEIEFFRLSDVTRESLMLQYKKERESISQPAPQVVPCVPGRKSAVKVCSTRDEMEKEEKAMITATIDHGNDQAKSHLRQRARSIRETKRSEARTFYGLTDEKSPQTANELIARIKEGKFVIEKDRGDETDWNNGMNYIRWRDPTKQEDKAGYKLAEEALDKQYIATKDTIIVMEPAAGLAAVQAFESTTVH